MRRNVSPMEEDRAFVNRLTVSAFVNKAKPNALVRREAQLGQVELGELPAGVVDSRKVAVVDSDAVDHHRLG